MKRDIYAELLRWKADSLRKPLVLRGARQTGKTYILKEFGKREYEKLHYINFEKNHAIRDFFDKSLDPYEILKLLSLFFRSEIKPGTDLVVFDEIQACNNALASLKYFQEDAPDFHIAAAGSLLGIKMSTPATFPVGKVNFLHLYPMTFFEFLEGLGEERYRRLLEEPSELKPFAAPFHDDLIALLRSYYFIGGMPEAISVYAETENLERVRHIHNDILSSYELDFAKHATPVDIPRLSQIWQSIPRHLAKENRRFLFSAVHPSARSREYENALQWLKDAALIHFCYAVEKVEIPLKGFTVPGVFKVYALDVGLLAAMAGIDTKTLIKGDELFSTYHGAFVENYVAQELAARSEQSLYYWKSEGKKAEVDFLFQKRNTVFPLEVKAGINPKSKSLHSYDTYFQPQKLLRSTLLNLKWNGKIINIPLYALGAVKRFC